MQNYIVFRTKPIKEQIINVIGIIVPEDYVNRNNIENWLEEYWDDNNEKAEQAKCLMAATDQCCFCQFDCPTPSQLENENRFQGVLDSLWDHIETNHQLEYEWLG